MAPKVAAAQPAPEEPGPWPGQIAVPDGSVFMMCQGEARQGVPTVVFDNGLGNDYTVWSEVQPEVARVTRSCAYDRIGVGRSTPTAEDDTRTPFEMVETLRTALWRAGVEGPYVLVGHSIAGLILLAYPHLHPDDVAGLVFVDASHPEQWDRFKEADPERDDPPPAVGRERIDRVAAGRELAAVGTFGHLPVVVLHQAAPTKSPLRPIWIELQEHHASRSTASRLVPATESGHYVQRDQPELVIEAIRWVLEGV